MEELGNPAWKQDVNVTVRLPRRKKKATGMTTGVTKLQSWAGRKGKKVGFWA